MKTLEAYKKENKQLRDNYKVLSNRYKEETIRMVKYKNAYLQQRLFLTNKFNWLVDISVQDKVPSITYLIKSLKDILVQEKI